MFEFSFKKCLNSIVLFNLIFILGCNGALNKDLTKIIKNEPIIVSNQEEILINTTNKLNAKNITVLIRKVTDNQSHNHIGKYYIPLGVFEQELWRYEPDINLSEVMTTKLAKTFEMDGFNVLRKSSERQSYDFEVKTKILKYFFSIERLIGSSTKAEVLLEVKIFDAKRNLIFDEKVSSKNTCETAEPKFINNVAKEVVYTVVKKFSNIRLIAKLLQERNFSLQHFIERGKFFTNGYSF